MLFYIRSPFIQMLSWNKGDFIRIFNNRQIMLKPRKMFRPLRSAEACRGHENIERFLLTNCSLSENTHQNFKILSLSFITRYLCNDGVIFILSCVVWCQFHKYLLDDYFEVFIHFFIVIILATRYQTASILR